MVKASTRQSGLKSTKMSGALVPMNATKKRLIPLRQQRAENRAGRAKQQAFQEQLADQTPRDAPSERRTVISRSRALARAQQQIADIGTGNQQD